MTTRVLLDEEGREHTFRYLLLEEDGRCGVKIEEAGGESARTVVPTFSRSQAMALLERYARCGATPVDLAYLLEDLETENRLPGYGRR